MSCAKSLGLHELHRQLMCIFSLCGIYELCAWSYNDACAEQYCTGFLPQNRQALPCSKGSWKAGIDKAPSCMACPTGLTTREYAATDSAACNRSLPGYQAVRTADNNGAVYFTATVCPIGTFSEVEGAQSCSPCPYGLTTRAPVQTSNASCLAPPGHGFFNSSVAPCPSGTFKEDWGNEPCMSCGEGLLTDTSDGPATSRDNCYIPPGWGSKHAAFAPNAANTLIALRCGNGTYGVAAPHHGLEPSPCQVGV
jgi:Tyrosine-protein kinase ephrin type A/B receptor-like